MMVGCYTLILSLGGVGPCRRSFLFLFLFYVLKARLWIQFFGTFWVRNATLIVKLHHQVVEPKVALDAIFLLLFCQFQN